jgi:hypothetical protein
MDIFVLECGSHMTDFSPLGYGEFVENVMSICQEQLLLKISPSVTSLSVKRGEESYASNDYCITDLLKL